MPRTPRSSVKNPAVAYQADVRSRAKLFPNGRSQAVRLPVEFRLPGTEVYIHRDGDRIILEPITEQHDANGWPIGFWDDVRRNAPSIDVPNIEPLGGALLTPEQIFPTKTSPR